MFIEYIFALIQVQGDIRSLRQVYFPLQRWNHREHWTIFFFTQISFEFDTDENFSTSCVWFR